MLLTFGQQLDPLKTECTKLSKYSSSSISTSQLNMNKMKFCSLLPVKATWDQNRDLQHCLRDGGGFVLLHHLNLPEEYSHETLSFSYLAFGISRHSPVSETGGCMQTI